MLVSVGDLIWGAIGLATLALIVTLVAVAWEARSVLRVASLFATQLERDVSPMLQDLQHITHRLDNVSAVVGDKAEKASHLVDRAGESLAVGRLRARDAWDDTRMWLESLRVGWQAGLAVIRDGANGHNGHVAMAPPATSGPAHVTAIVQEETIHANGGVVSTTTVSEIITTE